MRETTFIKHNAERWKKAEEISEEVSVAKPDEVSDHYILLTDDLSYARTFFLRGKSLRYLNQLAGKFHHLIYKNKREQLQRIGTFWKYEVPLAAYECRSKIFYSLFIFCVAVFIGTVSAANDERYVRLILGDNYVDMTLKNIEKGDPMGVYRSMKSSTMFLGISMNNIYVSFLAFTMGIFTSFGTGYVLFNNGIMMGAFQFFFAERGLFWESFLAIYIHGALEISAIVIAGGAGIMLGNSILFPGTLPRGTAIMQGARVSLKLIIGLVPIFIVAGFLESYVTRQYNTMPIWLRATIIGASFLFIIFYFFIYPVKVHQKQITQHGN